MTSPAPSAPTPVASTSGTLARLGRWLGQAAPAPAPREDDLVTRLVAGVLHEVNTPLGALGSTAGSLRLLARRLRDDTTASHDPAVARELALLDGLAEVQAQTAARLAETMRALERFVDLDRAEIRPVDLPASVDAAVDMLRSGTRVGVRRDFAADLPRVRTRPRLLHRALLHLLERALEAAGPAGEIALAIHPTADGRIRIAVSDGGAALSATALAELFEPRIAPLGARVGLELDWAATRRAVEALGGELTAESSDGQGTTVTVLLPLSPPEAV